MSQKTKPAPSIEAIRWFNTDEAVTLDALRGRVVVLEAFQMLCPGCVSHGLPQAGRVFETFSRNDVVVLGLHSVFEHHAAQTPTSLEAFLHEYRIAFPVGVDRPDPEGPLPQTMRSYGMQGTPTLVLIDRKGHRRAQHFGHVPDLQLGAEIMTLMHEAADSP